MHLYLDVLAALSFLTEPCHLNPLLLSLLLLLSLCQTQAICSTPAGILNEVSASYSIVSLHLYAIRMSEAKRARRTYPS
jgi:hypothetical protein